MSSSLQEVLELASQEEREGLKHILKEESNDALALSEAVLRVARTTFENLRDKPLRYADILGRTAKKMKIKSSSSEVAVLEREICQKHLKSVLEKLTHKQKAELEEKLREEAKKYDKVGTLLGSGSILATLTMAQLSGFGVYLLATTTLSTLSGLIGVTFPFGVYTALTTTVSWLIGPAGLLMAGAFAFNGFTRPNYKKLIPAVVAITCIRSRLSISNPLMVPHTHCPYTRKPLIEIEETNVEHIIPEKLGGLRDYSFRCDAERNATLGSTFDVKLIDSPLVSIFRVNNGIGSKQEERKAHLRGRTKVSGEEVKIDANYRQDGRLSLRVTSPVMWTNEGRTKESSLLSQKGRRLSPGNLSPTMPAEGRK